jgi:hypothetical protein
MPAIEFRFYHALENMHVCIGADPMCCPAVAAGLAPAWLTRSCGAIGTCIVQFTRFGVASSPSLGSSACGAWRSILQFCGRLGSPVTASFVSGCWWRGSGKRFLQSVGHCTARAAFHMMFSIPVLPSLHGVDVRQSTGEVHRSAGKPQPNWHEWPLLQNLLHNQRFQYPAELAEVTSCMHRPSQLFVTKSCNYTARPQLCIRGRNRAGLQHVSELSNTMHQPVVNSRNIYHRWPHLHQIRFRLYGLTASSPILGCTGR